MKTIFLILLLLMKLMHITTPMGEFRCLEFLPHLLCLAVLPHLPHPLVV